MAGPAMKATKEQVRQMLKDIQSQYYRDRKAKRARLLQEEEAEARKWFEEMKRRATQYGYAVEGGVGFDGGDGWINGRYPVFRLK